MVNDEPVSKERLPPHSPKSDTLLQQLDVDEKQKRDKRKAKKAEKRQKDSKPGMGGAEIGAALQRGLLGTVFEPEGPLAPGWD